MFALRPYEPLDYMSIESPEMLGLPVEITKTMAEAFAAHPSFTGTWEGRPIGCGGIVRLWPGLGQAWVIRQADLHECRVSFHKAVREELVKIAYVLELRRVEAMVNAMWPEAIKWIEHLSFHRENTKALWGPGGETYHEYVWFPGQVE